MDAEGDNYEARFDGLLLSDVLDEVRDEYLRAVGRFSPFNSPHEGYAVILEELDELWEEVRNQKTDGWRERARGEAIQVAAMAVRFMMDLGGEAE